MQYSDETVNYGSSLYLNIKGLVNFYLILAFPVYRLMSTLRKITNLKKLAVDDSVSKETFSEIVQSLVDWGNSASPVFTMVRIHILN